MAEIVTVEGEQYKRRSPWGVWGLSLVTVGVYGLVWYYKINNEARHYLRDETIRPGVALLALVPGFLIVVPPFISIWNTGTRISRMEEKTGIAKSVEPVVGLLAWLVYSLNMPYFQDHLNKVWDKGQANAGAAPPAPPHTVPPIPPTPPPG